MFSVIVPVFNKSLYIEKCLISILNQTFIDFEIIVVDDGSTDDSAVKVRDLIQKNVSRQQIGTTSGNSFKNLTNFGRPSNIKLVSQHNSGVSIARNNAVNLAKHEYIAFLDADDWWEPSYLEGMKSMIEDYPGAGIYGSNYYLVKNGRKQISTIGVEKNFEKGLINYCQVYTKTLCMPLWTGATVIRKTIFETLNGFKQELKFGEDFDLWIRVALKYDVAFLNIALANYNQDVELEGRAIGNLHKPESHMLWNLEYLAGEESVNSDYKQLIDNLRIYSLFPYYLHKNYHELAMKELKKVDWSKQPASARRRYATPVFILKIVNNIQSIGSRIKQLIISKFHLSIR